MEVRTDATNRQTSEAPHNQPASNDASGNQRKSLVTAGMFIIGCIVLATLIRIFSSFKRNHTSEYIQKTKEMLQRAGRSYAISQQDSSPLIGLMHASEGLAYISSARSMLPAAELDSLSKSNVQDIEAALKNQQDMALRTVAAQCPATRIQGSLPALAAWYH